MDVSTWSIVYNIIHTYVQGHGDLCLWIIELQLDWSCLLFTLSHPIIGRIYITCIYIIHVGLPMNPILDSLWFTWFNVFVFYRIWFIVLCHCLIFTSVILYKGTRVKPIYRQKASKSGKTTLNSRKESNKWIQFHGWWLGRNYYWLVMKNWTQVIRE